MSLPESIPVRYTEEEAGYISVRPVVRQSFQLAELARASQPHYESYSYVQRGDLSRVSLGIETGSQLLRELLEAAPRSLRMRLAALRPPAGLIFLCPRTGGSLPRLSKS